MKLIHSFLLILAVMLVVNSPALSQIQRVVGGTRLDLDDNAGNHVFLTNTSSSLGINSGGTAPNSCSILDLTSTTKGLLVPRLTSVQELALCGGTPPEGLIAYNTSTHTFDFYSGSAWNSLGLNAPSVTVVPEVVTFLGAYNAGTTYNQNDLVSSSTANTYFYSLTGGANVGHTPETSPASWAPVRVEQLRTIRKTNVTLSSPGFTSLISVSGLTNATGAAPTAGGRIQYTIFAGDGTGQTVTESGMIQWLCEANVVTCLVQPDDKLHLGTVNSGCTPGFFNPGSQPGVSIFDNVSFTVANPITIHEVYFRLTTEGGLSYSGGVAQPITIRLEP